MATNHRSSSGKPGRKRNLTTLRAVIADLHRVGNKPTVAQKDEIARKAGVSRKTVERIMEDLRETLAEWGTPSPEKRQEVIEAVVDKIGREIMTELQNEGATARQRQD